MSWELWLGVGGMTAAVVLGLLYGKARWEAAQAHQYKLAAERWKTVATSASTVIADKEDYIRELEKTVLGSLPPGKLVDRLNRMFPSSRRPGTSTVPPAASGTKPSKP